MIVTESRLTSLIKSVAKGLRGTSYERGVRLAAKGKLADAAAAWQEGAKQNDPQCQMALAEALESGRGVLPNPRSAFRWYQAAAENGVARAQAFLASHYANGIGDASAKRQPDVFVLEKNDAQARRWASLAAEQGMVEAQVLLGWLYARDGGPEAPLDITQSIMWYQRTIDQGSIKGMVGLANLIAAGSVTGQGPAEAFTLYEQAARLGDPTAQYYTGLYLLEGIGTAADQPAALEWLLKAAEAGIVAACRTLGIIHRRGRGAPINFTIAETWLRRGAVKGDSECMALLADMHMGRQAAVPNPGEAIVWYTAASELGHAGALAALGLAHQTGKFVPLDPLRAIHFLEKATQAGHVEAAFHLGISHLEGRGIPVDYGKAAQLLAKAAEQGHPNATYNLGVLYFHGHGVARDQEKAMGYYARSAELGSPSGQFRLAHALATGQELLPADPEKALYWFTLAAEQGHVPAQVNLVRMLTSRQAPLEELERWRTRLQEAASHGMAIAMTVLAEMKWNIDRDAPAAIEMARAAIDLGDPQAEQLVAYFEARSFSGIVR
ncbi:hypothetical protein GE253_05240 [Niveispirillum sp. SYP-B3756]|uniref:tetratricopeptide repeat protein n=1 Tax=Niveispirillum sp. SYP-B3756 TaxID=2662178 RepID=UPI001290E995|nr:hypothetical protein [Niveispirillum sp. SYP-B3756]